MSELDPGKHDRRVWLVRVPPYVAKHWKAACDAAASGAVGDDGDDVPSLGTVLITTLPNKSTRSELRLPESMVDDAMPRTYTMQLGNNVESSVLSVAKSAGSAGGGAGDDDAALRLADPRLDGVVAQKHDLVPADAQAAAAAGGPGVDAAYRALSRKRTLASQLKGRTVALMEGAAAKSLYGVQYGRGELYVKDTAAARQEAAAARAARAAAAPAKRARMDKRQLEQLLCSLFERQEQWHLPVLVKETDQPLQWLREVLSEVAVLVKRGTAQDVWELKPHLKVGAAAGGGGGADGFD